MLIISHRGNLSGPDTKIENLPKRIVDVTVLYDCEIDVWVKDNGSVYLGHDEPQYRVFDNFFENQRLWCHAKNLNALNYLIKLRTKCFYHNKDNYTLVSNGIIWAYPNMYVNAGCIIVDTTKKWRKHNYNCFGVCVDYIL